MSLIQERAVFRRLVDELVGTGDPDAERQMGDSFDDRLTAAWELVDVGEEGIGLEVLCGNIVDYLAPLSPAQFSAIVELTQAWESAADRLSGLRARVRQ